MVDFCNESVRNCNCFLLGSISRRRSPGTSIYTTVWAMTLTQKQDNGWNRALCNMLDDMRQRKAFCDTIILTDNGHVFTAHACILAAASPVLKTHLMSRDIHIQINGIAKRTWEILLQFIYCGNITIVDAVEVEQVLQAGILLNLTGLSELCKNLFLADTTNQTCGAESENMSRSQEETNSHHDTQTDLRVGGSDDKKGDINKRRNDDKNSYVDDNAFPKESTHCITEDDSFTADGEACETEIADFVAGNNHVPSECHGKKRKLLLLSAFTTFSGYVLFHIMFLRP